MEAAAAAGSGVLEVMGLVHLVAQVEGAADIWVTVLQDQATEVVAAAGFSVMLSLLYQLRLDLVARDIVQKIMVAEVPITALRNLV